MSKEIKKSEKNVPQQGSRYVASADNDITISFWNDILPLQDPTVEAKAPHKGLALYEELLRDGRVRSAINKRANKLIQREWEVVSASEEPADIEAAEFGERVLHTFAFDHLCRDLDREAILKGFAITELLWGRNERNEVVPIGFRTHEQTRFVFDKEWKPRLRTWEQPHDGVPLPARKFIVHRFDAKANNPYGLGLGATLYWHVLFKREGVAFWMVLLEKFSSPVPVAKYPDGWKEPEVDKLVKKLRSMVQSGIIAVPVGAEVDYLENSNSGDAGYAAWCRYWDEQTSEVVNGETLTTNIQGQGSRAATETHSEEGDQVVDGDADLLSDTLASTLMSWLIELNYPNAQAPRVIRKRPKNLALEEEQKTKRAKRQQETLKLLRQMKAEGYQPTDLKDWLEDELECELEELPEELKAQAQAILNPPTPANQNGAVDPRAKSGDASDKDELKEKVAQFVAALNEQQVGPYGHLVEQLVELGDDGLAGLLEAAEQEFEAADDYGDLSARLLDLVGSNRDESGIANFGDAMALADLIGRGEIYDETGVRAKYPKRSKKN